ncbi:protein of unknown function (DUF1996) domain containing protein [Rhypophila decipiens]
MKSRWVLSFFTAFGSMVSSSLEQGIGPPPLPNGPSFNDFLRFSCSELNIQRIDPGNALAPRMDHPELNITATATCTTCTFTEDLSNYWTAVLFFRHRNGSYHRAPLMGNLGLEGQRGGMTVYYTAPYDKKTKVTAFKPGFRMLVGDPSLRSQNPNEGEYNSIAFRCFTTPWGPAPPNSAIGDPKWDTHAFPNTPCPYGLRINNFFPTCWDGVNVDSPDHKSHVAFPVNGTFESGGVCPDSHPVRLPQVRYETIWDTSAYSDTSVWPIDEKTGQVTQPFVFSMGDATGYGWHGDYMFGWEGDSLQRAMDRFCGVDCPVLKKQSIAKANKCAKEAVVKELIDGWLDSLPGMS